MFGFFKTAQASWIWLVLRLYVGYEWVSAGWEKLTGKDPFSAEAFVKGAIGKASGAHPAVQGWWADFLNSFALPNIGLFNFLVQYGELLTGLALIVGFATLFACTTALIMNFAFILSGSGSTNPQLAILELFIFGIGGAYAGYLGVDYWFRPIWRNFAAKYRLLADAPPKAA